jgi:glutamate-1-semialdehyde aminotransferase/spore coat polysaccharide biosynthesis protein SpsF (cytidylyltransferase family)
MKVLALIQARMGSTRLPGKVMKPILGRPMVELLLKRLSGAKLIDQIVLATSEQPENDALADHVRSIGFEVFRGSENDVLDRFYHAAQLYKGDAIIRITADCPLIDPGVVDEVIAAFTKSDVDYMCNILPPTYPDGLDTEIFTAASLERAFKEATRPLEREHVTPYIRESGLFTTGNVANDVDHSKERWTVDEPADFQVVEAVFTHFHPRVDVGWLEIMKLKATDPSIFAANQKIIRNEGYMKNKFEEIKLRNITNFKESDAYRKSIHHLIPGGAHTYSKGDDQFPELSPAAIAYGKGSHLWDIDGNEYLDCSMGLTSISLGHAYKPVVDRIKEELDNGVNFQRPSILEKEMAETFLSLVPQHDMVKFAKNGSIVTTAAVKLARAFTGKKLVAFPGDHPFYSYDDWFIGTTQCNKGVPQEITDLSVTFTSYDIESLKKLFEKYPGQIACIITEPEKNSYGDRTLTDEDIGTFLKEAIELAHANGALFIADEMITGFKTGFPGSISKYGIDPDMATWGKGIGNGFSFCALTGKKSIMELGSITRTGEEKVFLISTTHGGETTAIAAALATIKEFKEKNVLQHLHQVGDKLLELTKRLVHNHGLEKHIDVFDCNWMPAFAFKDAQEKACQGFRTLFMQEMIKRGVLFQGFFVPCFSHTEDDIYYFAKTFNESLEVYKKALTDGYEKYLVGSPAKAVFRKVL